MGRKLSSTFLQIIENAQNVNFITTYYKWHLITEDPDDNKFVDCYVASHSDCLITNDKHFNPIKNVAFPGINILSIEEFKGRMR